MTVIAGKPESCKVCPLYLSKEGIVWGEGKRDAKIMAVGEAPGEDEGTALRPFVGGSGRVFNALLQHAGIDRKDLFVTNVVKCRPTAIGAGGRIVNRQPTETEIRCCAKFLVHELEEIKPNTVLALGNVPLHTLTSVTKGITVMRSVPLEGPKRRGSALRENGPSVFKVIPTLHPAAVMRQQNLWPAVVFDLVRAGTESAFPSIVRRPWSYHIHAKLSEVGESLRRRIEERRGPALLASYDHDLETTGLDPRKDTFRCIGIAAEPDEVFCFDWTSDVIEFVRDLHKDANLTVVGQNSEGFDIPFQEAKGFRFEGPSYDTLIGHHLLNSDLPKDLAFIGASCTDEVHWKDNTMYKSGEDALQVGCCKDIHATGRARQDQLQEMEKLGQLDLYFKHIMPVQPVHRAMTRRGLRKDQRAKVGWHTVLNRRADEFEVRLKKGLGDPTLDINSPQQLMDLLYRRMGLPKQYNQDRERGLRVTVDAEALDRLAYICESDPALKKLSPILQLVRTIRTLRKWDTTFVMCDEDENGFVHGKFSTAKAANGRFNSFDPNMQNFPLDMRQLFIPDSEDEVIVARDWSQIEWRIAMVLSGDRNGLDALAAGRDAHKDSYAKAFLREYDSVTKPERDIAKSINYGLLYGRGLDSLVQGKSTHGGLAKDGAIPMDRAVAYKSAFLKTFSEYDKYRKYLEEQVKKKHYIQTPWGRRRWWYTTQQMTEAYNFPISGSAAHMMYEALVEVDAQLPKGASLRLTVHDELVLVSSKEQKVLQQTVDCTREVMERAFPKMTEGSQYPDIVRHYYPNGWFCPTDCHIGETWKAAKCETKLEAAQEQVLLKKLGVTT